MTMSLAELVRLSKLRLDSVAGEEALQQAKWLVAAVVGIEIVGPFPDPLQEPVELSIGRSAQAGPGTGGEALLRFITSPEAMATFAAVGVEPVTDVRI